ncbi:MAG: hypothetical protein H6Q69_2176 [Firmicutes bacterium]|nr:hypothetical protein [Bacillota bacterium]
MVLHIKRLAIVVLLILGSCSQSAFAEPNWYWYYSSEYITQFCDMNSIKIIRDYNGNIDKIEAWVKTTYSYEGAQDTIKGYELTSVPNINQLSYSLEKICIKPQTRKIASKQEVFYNSEGSSLWSNEHQDYSLNWNIVSPNSSNEREFSIIVDEVYNSGKLIEFEKWKDGNGRWIGLSSKNTDEGSVQNTWFDSMSIILDNDRVFFWTFHKDIKDGITVTKNYNRWVYDINCNTMQLITMSVWEKDRGLILDNKTVTGKASSIIPESSGEYWTSTIKKYINDNRDYINRYSKRI